MKWEQNFIFNGKRERERGGLSGTGTESRVRGVAEKGKKITGGYREWERGKKITEALSGMGAGGGEFLPR